MLNNKVLFKIRANPNGKACIVYFPHAGGSATQFVDLAQRLPTWMACASIEYPGHGRRAAEPLKTNLWDLANDIATTWDLEHGSLVFFGHSMGGLVAYEVARRLEERGIGPNLLIVSATRAPHLTARGRKDEVTDAELVARLSLMNGTEAALLDNADFISLSLPIYRTDIVACEDYMNAAAAPLAARVMTYGGVIDPHVDRRELEGWLEIGSRGIRMFPGGHFYYKSETELFLEALSRDVLNMLTDKKNL